MNDTSAPYRNPRLPIDRRVADLLARMTLDEKLAQMAILPGEVDPLLDEQGRLDAGKARQA